MSTFPYDEASKPNQFVTTDTSTPEDKYPCQQKKVWYGGGSGGENPTSYVPGSGGSGYNCQKKNELSETNDRYDKLLEAYNKACYTIDALTKEIINLYQENADIKREMGKLYVKIGKTYIEYTDEIKNDKADLVWKINQSIDRSFLDEKDDPSELTKPDPDHWSDSIAKVSEHTKPDIDQIMKNEFQNVLNTERGNLDPASITTKDYPKANYEVTAKN